ncbi:nucleoid occlusion protein [Ligilactobacillus cholophilus]|uniref:nucleoid occlusion protein n=1 Tax=Ligilactobacillus cholophilus TaxID=3050131 RepID=UPI0025B0213B|nr:nucleoid occlusion protein [Ligilactobacillus cholophilus]
MAFFWNKKKQSVKSTEDHPETQVEKIEIKQIIPNRFQPRQVFSQQKITELAETIKEHGLLQPIVLREYEENKYEIIAGERRFRAIKYLGWSEVPAIVKTMSDNESASMAVIENLQREELTAIEEAQAYQQLLELNRLTQAELAEQLGKSQSFIANKLRLLKLSQPVQQALLDRKISERHGRALVRLNEEQQKQVLKEILNQHLSVKETEKKVNRLIVPRMKPKKPKIKGVSKDVRLAVNTIKQSVKMVKDTGIKVNVEEETTDDVQKIIIEIPLNKRK